MSLSCRQIIRCQQIILFSVEAVHDSLKPDVNYYRAQVEPLIRLSSKTLPAVLASIGNTVNDFQRNISAIANKFGGGPSGNDEVPAPMTKAVPKNETVFNHTVVVGEEGWKGKRNIIMTDVEERNRSLQRNAGRDDTDRTVEKVQSGVDSASKTMQGVKEGAEETLKGLKDGVEETAEKIGDTAKQGAESVKNGVNNALKSLKNSAGKVDNLSLKILALNLLVGLCLIEG